jgi:pimeloyl-ACP methyl ester carboxylesterase
MNVPQRIAINFYKTKINALAVISTHKAAEFAFKIFCTPYSGKPFREAPTIFQKAASISLKFQDLMVRGWHWQPTNDNGKKILISHGFDSYSYRFEKYIQPLLTAGFQVYAFDAPAHGKITNALQYSEVMLAINNTYGAFYGIMGHSFGGQAAAIAAENLPNLQKLVLIAPAVETTTAIDGFIKFLGLSNDIKEALTQYIINYSKKPIAYFATSTAIKKFKTPTLWLHDTEDAICTFEDVKPVVAMNLQHVAFYITTGLGHSKIYREPKTIDTILDFFINNG